MLTLWHQGINRLMFLLLVACSQILLYIHESMMKTTQKYMEKEALSSLGELGEDGRVLFYKKETSILIPKGGNY